MTPYNLKRNFQMGEMITIGDLLFITHPKEKFEVKNTLTLKFNSPFFSQKDIASSLLMKSSWVLDRGSPLK